MHARIKCKIIFDIAEDKTSIILNLVSWRLVLAFDSNESIKGPNNVESGSMKNLKYTSECLINP